MPPGKLLCDCHFASVETNPRVNLLSKGLPNQVVRIFHLINITQPIISKTVGRTSEITKRQIHIYRTLTHLFVNCPSSESGISITNSEDCGKWPSRVLGVSTKVCLKGPFDRPGSLCIRNCIYEGGGEHWERGGGKDKRFQVLPPSCPFQAAVSLPGPMWFMLSIPVLLLTWTCLSSVHKICGNKNRALFLCPVGLTRARYFIRITRCRSQNALVQERKLRLPARSCTPSENLHLFSSSTSPLLITPFFLNQVPLTSMITHLFFLLASTLHSLLGGPHFIHLPSIKSGYAYLLFDSFLTLHSLPER